VTLAVALLSCFGTTLTTEPIVHRTNEQVSAITKKVSETGIIDVSTSITDKKIALEYGNFMAGDGDIELNQERA